MNHQPDRSLIDTGISLTEKHAAGLTKRRGRTPAQAGVKRAQPPVAGALTRATTLIEALAGNVIEGMRLSPLAMMLGESASTTLRDLQALESIGYAERIPGREDCWRLTSRLCRIANAHREEMARHRSRLDNIDRNYTLPPN